MIKGLRKRLAVIFTVFTGAVLAAALGITFYQAATTVVANRELWFSSTVDRVNSVVVNNALGQEKTSIYSADYIIYVQSNSQPVPGLLAEGVEGAQPAAVQVVSQQDMQAMFTQAKTIAQEKGLTDWVHSSYLAMAPAYSSTMEITEDPYGNSYQVEVGVLADAYHYSGDNSVAITMGPLLGTDGLFNMRYKGESYRATYFSLGLTSYPSNTETLYEVAIMESLGSQNRQLLLEGLTYLLVLLAGLALLFLANWFLAGLVLRPTQEGFRRQTEFVAAASHELRSPLAVIRSSLSAAEIAPNVQQAQKFQAAAAEEAERMSHLVDDLLLLAGGDAGSWTLHKALVDLDTLLIDAGESFAPLAKEREVELQLQLPGTTLPTVQGDAERLRQILAVLLDNALQYAPKGTTVALCAKAKRGRVTIAVEDRGRGVDEAEKGKIFERFYRAEKSRHSKNHFGLGLSIAKDLAQLHGGSLMVQDTQGGGATFVLTLPVA